MSSIVHPTLLLKLHSVLQTSQLFNPDLNFVAMGQPLRRCHSHRNSSRSTCHNDRSLLQSSSLADKLNDVLNSKEQIVCSSILPQLSIHEGLETQITGIANDRRRNEDRAQRGKFVEAFAEAPLRHASSIFRVPLPCSGGDIVASQEASHMLEGLGPGDILAGFPYHNRELSLVVELILLSNFGDWNVLIKASDACFRLDENRGIRWRLPPSLLNYGRTGVR